MQIKKLSLKNNDVFDVFMEHINKNEPFIISDFIENYNNDIKYSNNSLKDNISFEENAPKCSINNLLNFFNTSEKKCGFNCYQKNKKKKIICSNSILNKFFKNKRFIFHKGIRIWENKKGKFTADHFDFFGQGNFNICLKGKKKFFLAKPNTFNVLPNTNLSINVDKSKYNYEVILKPKEMLYIPPFWHHRVYTLENSFNFNIFYWDYNQKFTNANKSYLMLHKILNTKIYKESGYIKIFKNENPYTLNTLKFFILNNFLIIIISNLLLNKFNLNLKIILLTLIILIIKIQKKQIHNLYTQFELLSKIIVLAILFNIISHTFRLKIINLK